MQVVESQTGRPGRLPMTSTNWQSAYMYPVFRKLHSGDVCFGCCRLAHVIGRECPPASPQSTFCKCKCIRQICSLDANCRESEIERYHQSSTVEAGAGAYPIPQLLNFKSHPSSHCSYFFPPCNSIALFPIHSFAVKTSPSFPTSLP